MTERPRIKSWLRPVRRRAGEVQFGVGPSGVIVQGLTSAEAQLLPRLDGSLTRRATFELALAAGVPADRWRELLDVLDQLDLLDRQHRDGFPARLVRGHVLVDGCGDLASDCAALLRRCGIERVSHGRTAVDVSLGSPRVSRPDMVVIVGDRAIDPRRGDVWLRQRVPHLPVIVSGTQGEVGPVLSAAPGTPCLWCLDLHRSDRDEEWPTVMAQLCRAEAESLLGPPVDVELPAGLAQLVSGVVGLYAVGLLTGDHPPAGVSAEVSLPWPRMDHRRWSRHPRCERHVRAHSDVA